MTLYYFAYGSNMLTARMCERIPAAEVAGIARLQNWKLVWDKASKDGSTKANLKPDDGSVVWGVVYHVPEEKITHLDKIEGGYQRVSVIVEFTDGESQPVVTYISEERNVTLVPYDWYKQIVVDGAVEHSLPTEYIQTLASVEAKPDTHASRRSP